MKKDNWEFFRGTIEAEELSKGEEVTLDRIEKNYMWGSCQINSKNKGVEILEAYVTGGMMKLNNWERTSREQERYERQWELPINIQQKQCYICVRAILEAKIKELGKKKVENGIPQIQ